MKKIGAMSKKELLLELGRWMKKVEDQQKEILKLREKNNTFEAGSVQLSKIVDSIMVEVAKKFGNEVGDGVFEAVIPIPFVPEKQTEKVCATRDEERNTYTIRVEPVKDDKNVK